MLGLPGAVLAGWIIKTYAFPGNYAALYFIAFGFLAASWLVFALVDDVPEDVPEREQQGVGDYYGELGGALRDDHDYRNFLITQMFRHAAFTGVAFYAITAREYHGMDAGIVIAGLMICRRTGRMIGPLLGTWISETVGEKRAIQLGHIIAACSAMMAATAPTGKGWVLLAAALVWSIGGTSRHVGSQAVALKLYPRGRRVGYQTLRMVAVAVTGIIVAPIMGLLMDMPESWGIARPHTITFGFVAVLNVLGAWPMQYCRVPDEDEIARRDGTEERQSSESEDNSDEN